MENNLPKLQVQGTISGDIPVLLQIFNDKYDPEKISTELILLSEDKEISGSFRACLSGDEYGTIKIVSNNDQHSEICLHSINGWSHQGTKAKLNIEGYEYGISDNPIENAENIYVYVELTPSGILRKWGSKELHFDGSIKQNEGYPEEIQWDLPIGKGKAFSRYTYEDHTVYDNNATIQIERPALYFEIETSKNPSTSEIKQEIEREAKDICLILSLCYRKLVRWYEMNFIIIPSERDAESIVSPVVRQKVYREMYPDRVEELINHRTPALSR